MHIIRLDEDTIMHGRITFEIYLARTICGPGSPACEAGPHPPSGADLVAGAILECIDHRIRQHGDIIHAVSRATRCRKSTVAKFLNFLKGDDPARHLWQAAGEHYHALERRHLAETSAASILLAA